MAMQHNGKNGFGLVDLVIVVIILGIVAAITVPRMSRGARNEDPTLLHHSVATLRQAIARYAEEHGGVYPGATDGTAATFIAQLTLFTNEAGDVSTTRDEAHPYGPYLPDGIPPAPFGAHKNSTAVWIDTKHTPPIVDETIGAGWLYNPHTGEIVVNAIPPAATDRKEDRTDLCLSRTDSPGRTKEQVTRLSDIVHALKTGLTFSSEC